MAVKQILPTDTLETGFRAKYNETVNEIITDYTFSVDGFTLRLKKFGGGFIDINLQQYYYTKQQLNTVLSGLTGSPYLGLWNTVSAQAGQYTSGIVVDYGGLFWRSNDITTEADIPGISNKWTDIIIPALPTWIASTYIKNATVKKQIGNVFYQFVSQVNNNSTEPFLTPGVAPWAQSGVFAGNWVSGPYLVNQTVARSGHLYNAITNNSTDPLTNPSDWKDLGTNQGVFNINYSGGYLSTDAVYDANNNAYESNIGSNSYPLEQLSTMQWDLIGTNPVIPDTINITILIGAEATYNLTSDELISLNALNKMPNIFPSLVTGFDGDNNPTAQTYPATVGMSFTGAPGSFTAVSINVSGTEGQGAGTATDNNYIQLT